jgi:hypothetical protein
MSNDKTLPDQSRSFVKSNVVTARIVLDNPENFGDGMVDWAKSVLQKHEGGSDGKDTATRGDAR